MLLLFSGITVFSAVVCKRVIENVWYTQDVSSFMLLHAFPVEEKDNKERNSDKVLLRNAIYDKTLPGAASFLIMP